MIDPEIGRGIVEVDPRCIEIAHRRIEIDLLRLTDLPDIVVGHHLHPPGTDLRTEYQARESCLDHIDQDPDLLVLPNETEIDRARGRLRTLLCLRR